MNLIPLLVQGSFKSPSVQVEIKDLHVDIAKSRSELLLFLP